jgi:hypothetical protein
MTRKHKKLWHRITDQKKQKKKGKKGKKGKKISHPK